MSDYYKIRTNYLFDPYSSSPYRLSRSKIDLFIQCPRCFYLDRRLGIKQPPGYPFSLNSAVDKLLKKEFDIHRANGVAHPLMKKYKIKAIPLAHEKLDQWRDSLHYGITYLYEKTNFLITGGVDDIWINPQGEYIIVDYKATSKDEEVNLDAEWQKSYKRQAEIYQWLFRKNNFKVSDTAYFVYCNGKTDRKAFDAKLEFDIKIIPYVGSDKWIEKTILEIKSCLMKNEIPKASADCDYCRYRRASAKVEKDY